MTNDHDTLLFSAVLIRQFPAPAAQIRVFLCPCAEPLPPHALSMCRPRCNVMPLHANVLSCSKTSKALKPRQWPICDGLLRWSAVIGVLTIPRISPSHMIHLLSSGVHARLAFHPSPQCAFVHLYIYALRSPRVYCGSGIICYMLTSVLGRRT